MDLEMASTASCRHEKSVENVKCIQTVRIGQIAGEHEAVQSIREELGLYFIEPPVGEISEAGLIRLARHLPIGVAEKDGRYWCIAGFRVFRLLRAGLPEDAEIPVLFQQRRIRVAVLRESILCELLIVPIILGLHPRDKKLMGNLWKEPQKSAFLKLALTEPGSNALAKMLGCDPRSLGK